MNIPVLKRLLLLAIRAYQRYLSPYKGFRCAYRVHTGCASCSALGYRAIRRFGSFAGLIVLRRRLERCGDTYRQHHPSRPINYQAGECDIGGCDLDCSVMDAAGNVCDVCGNCDRPRRTRRDPEPRGPLF